MSSAEDRPVSLLLVEDDAIDVMTVERMLRKQRVANPLFVAHDGVEALEMLRGEGGREHVPSPYMILLDLNMPRMGGLEFLDKLRADPEHEKAVVFVLTTSDAPEDRAAAYEHRVAGYIVKDRMGDDLLDLLLIQFARAGRDWRPREVDLGKLVRGGVQRLRVLDTFKVEIATDMPRLRTAANPLEYVFLTLMAHIARRRVRRGGRLDITWEDTGTHLRFSMLITSGRPRKETSRNLRELMEGSPLSGRDAETVGLVVTRNVVESVGGHISMVPSGAACSFTWPRDWPEAFESAPPLSVEVSEEMRVLEEDTQLVSIQSPDDAFHVPPELQELEPISVLPEVLSEADDDGGSIPAMDDPDDDLDDWDPPEPQTARQTGLLMALGPELDAGAIERALRERGVEAPIVVAGDGEAALARLKGKGNLAPMPRPFIALIDLELPGLNGLELLDALRHDTEHHRTVAFILAASDAPEDRLSAYDQGIAGYLPLSRCGDDYGKLADLLALYLELTAPAPV